MTDQYRQTSLSLIALFFALLLNACASVQKPKVQIKDVHQLGGSFTAVCVTPNAIHLKSHFRFLSLKYQNLGLKLKQYSRLFHTNSKLNLKTKAHARLLDKPSAQVPKFKPFKQNLSLNNYDPCPQVEAWVKLNAKSRLSMRWHERSLTISPNQWHWGTERRDQLTRLRDMSPMSFAHNKKAQRYLISSQYGLWTWKSSQKYARSITLPHAIPQNVMSLAKDQDAWWLKTSSADTTEIWPISLKSGQARLIAPPIKQKLSNKPQALLAPLSGVALRGQVDGLELQWGSQDYPFQALQSLCVLSKRMVAVATKAELIILLGPKLAEAKPLSSEAQLTVIKKIVLPTKTTKLLCEKQRIFALGEGYGLLILDLEATADLTSAELSSK